MKTILVPTDFSETATNAISYAAEFAKYTKSKLILFHAYHVPVMISEMPITLSQDKFQLEEESDEQMNLIVENIKKTYGNDLMVDAISFPGFASEEIAHIAKEKECDLIIMGTRGASGITKILGSNTVAAIKRTHCNILVIPSGVRFKKIDRIVFAFDYLEIQNRAVLNPIIEIGSLFDSEILIFNMSNSHIKKPLNKELGEIKMEDIFGNLKHSYWFSENKNIVDGINRFTVGRRAAMIAMVRRHYNLFQQIFTKSNTKQMALNTHFPLLILNE